MAKKTILKKIFFMITSLVITTIILATLFNKIYLSKYYLKKKRLKMQEVAELMRKGEPDDQNILEFLQKENIFFQIINKKVMEREIEEKLDKKNFEKNLNHRKFKFKNENEKIIIPIRPDFRKRSLNERKQDKNTLKEKPPRFPFEKENGFKEDLKKVKESLEKEEPVTFIALKPEMFILIDQLNENDILILATPIASIAQAAGIAFEFYIYTGFVTLILGMIMSYIFARKISEPIKQINEMAKNMKNLNFSEKLNIKTDDEIEELAKNVNYLSHELENYIQKISLVNEKLREDIEKERENDKKRIEFLGNVSHEIKTPVALINTYAECLKENIVEDEESRNYYCDVIIDEGKNISVLMEGLLKLIEMQDIKIELYKQKFSLFDLIAREVKKFSLDLEEKNVKLNLEFPSQKEKYIVNADEIKIQQVINNFMSNAVSHVNNNGEIKVSFYEEKEKIIVEIYNSGSKIPSESIEQIWQPFYKIDKARTRKYGGTGLGLSIVKVILDKHGSQYGSNNIKKGVKFWFDLELV